MTSRARVVIVAVALWSAVVAGSSTAAWLVIDRAGRDVFNPTVAAAHPSTRRSDPISSGPTTRPPGATSAPSSGSHGPSGGASSPSPRTPGSTDSAAQTSAGVTIPTNRDSIRVIGGTVGVSCQGANLTLLSATPGDGWSMQVEREPGSLSVAFRQQQGGGESEVHATCRGGVAAFETSSRADTGSADDS